MTDKIANHLASILDTYSGPWTRSLPAILFIILGGHIAAHYLVGMDWFSPAGLLSVFIYTALLVFVARWVKRRYPGKSEN